MRVAKARGPRARAPGPLKDTKDDKECRAKVYERHANVPVE